MLRSLVFIMSAAIATCGFGASANSRTQVYLMRGLMDVSTGLDDLAAKLKRRGLSASVASYTAENQLAGQALANFKSGRGCPIVIIGHSLGADAAIGMSRTLEQSGVPVALLVAFSPAASKEVPGNVARAVNYYQSNSYWNHVYTRASGSRATVRNVNLSKDAAIDHFNIEKVARLHDETIRAIMGLGGGCSATPGRAVKDTAAKR